MTDQPIETESRALEVVEPEQKPEVHLELARKNAEIEAAAQAAVMMPGAPGHSEFLTLAMTAKMLSMSGAAPALVKGNPYVAFHVAMVGRDLGISPSAALNLIDVIQGRDGPQLSLSPQLLNGQIRRLGLGSIRPRFRSEERCVAVAYGPDGSELGESEFTWDDAKTAGLVGVECEPGNHSSKCSNKDADRRFKCNQGYRTYPKRMLWWRASGFAADDFFPEAGLGLYTAEELGAVVDENGRPIDPTSVALPEGYDEQKPKGVGAGSTDPEPTDPEAVLDLAVRIHALPEEEKADLRARWKQNEKLAGVAVHHLNAAGVKFADALVKGFENKAKAKGYKRDEATAAARERLGYGIGAALGLPEATDPGPGTPNPGPDDSGAPSGAQNPDSGSQAGSEPDEDAVAAEIARVKALKPAEVVAELEGLGLSVEGNSDTQRKRLVLAVLRARQAEIEKGSPE